jgi:hypothetical protein
MARASCSIAGFLRREEPKVWELIQSGFCSTRTFEGMGGLTFLVPDSKLLAELTKLADTDDEKGVEVLRSLIVKMNLSSLSAFKEYEANIPNANGRKLVIKKVGAKDVECDGCVIVPHPKWKAASRNKAQSVYQIKSGAPKLDTPEASPMLYNTEKGKYEMKTGGGMVEIAPAGGVRLNEHFDEAVRDRLVSIIDDPGQYVAVVKSMAQHVAGGSNPLRSFACTGGSDDLDAFNAASHDQQIKYIEGLCAEMFHTPAAVASVCGGAEDVSIDPSSLCQIMSPAVSAGLTSVSGGWKESLSQVEPTARTYADITRALKGASFGNRVIDRVFDAIGSVNGGMDVVANTAIIAGAESASSFRGYPASTDILNGILENVAGGAKKRAKRRQKKKSRGKTRGGSLDAGNEDEIAQLSAIIRYAPQFDYLSRVL